MSLAVTFDERAAAAFAAAASWYDEQRPGLGARFVLEVEHVLTLAAEQPGMGAPLRRPKGARRLLVDGFPYALRYLVRGSELRVLVVAHQARRPSP